jgi:hypothetical protein
LSNMHWETIPREVRGEADLGTVYVREGDEYRIKVSPRMTALGVPSSRWMPVTKAMHGLMIGVDTEEYIEVRRQFPAGRQHTSPLPREVGTVQWGSREFIERVETLQNRGDAVRLVNLNFRHP